MSCQPVCDGGLADFPVAIAHEMLMIAGPHILINSTSIRPFHYLHYASDGMCLNDGIAKHCSSGDLRDILFE